MRYSNALMALVAAILLPVVAFGEPIRDQAHDQDVFCSQCTSGLAFVLAEGMSYVGQTVTTGIAGRLTSIEIAAAQRSNFDIPWLLEIFDAPGGIPNGTLLASSAPQALPTGFDPFNVFVAFDLISQPMLVAGRPFAIAIHPEGVTGPSPGLLAGAWAGRITSADPYPGGAPFFGPDPSDFSFSGEFPPFGTGDLLFRTFVDPVAVPQPPTYLLVLGVILVAILGRCLTSHQSLD